MTANKDRLFHAPRATVEPFEFGEETAAVFDDMLARSVPYYQDIQHMVIELGEQFVVDRSDVYDLGCSTGNTMMLLANVVRRLTDVKLIGVDKSVAMLERANEKLERSGLGGRYSLIAEDLANSRIDNASLVLMVLTLQFVALGQRPTILRRIREGMIDGGALILIEKVVCEDNTLDELFVDRYHEFKHRQGYSELEIEQKRLALENVLIPLATDANVSLLREAGFTKIDLFFRWYNFACFIAIK